MANDIVQTIADARVDARSLSEFVFKPADFMVARRLAPSVRTLQYYVDFFNTLQSNISTSVSAAQSSLNNSVAEAQGKVAYIETTVQDAINNTAVEGGVLADTFVTATANNGTIARTQRDVNSNRLDLRDFGILADGVNRTAEIVALMQSFSSDKRAVINASSGTRFNTNEVLESLPVGVSIELNGARSGHYTSTYKQKFYGILANDSRDDDTVHVVETGHHPAFGLINHRTADKDISNGAASILYGLGRVRLGSQRGVSIQQWVRNPTGKWNWSIRSGAPWESVDDKNNMFQPWSANETIKVGDYRLYKSQMYKAASSGITGATPPTHFEGDVAADDGITWKHVFRGDTTVLAIDETGSFAVNGTPSSTEQVLFNQSVNDTRTAYTMGINARGKNRRVSLAFTPTDSDGAAVSAPKFNATPDGELSIITIGQATSVCSFNGNSVTLKAVNYASILAAQGSETPSIANASSLVINNSTATTITDLLGAVSNQCVTLLFANANTTLNHNTNIRLQDSVDVTPTALSVITLQKFKAGSLTPAWIEVSRSIK